MQEIHSVYKQGIYIFKRKIYMTMLYILAFMFGWWLCGLLRPGKESIPNPNIEVVGAAVSKNILYPKS